MRPRPDAYLAWLGPRVTRGSVDKVAESSVRLCRIDKVPRATFPQDIDAIERNRAPAVRIIASSAGDVQ